MAEVKKTQTMGPLVGDKNPPAEAVAKVPLKIPEIGEQAFMRGVHGDMLDLHDNQQIKHEGGSRVIVNSWILCQMEAGKLELA